MSEIHEAVGSYVVDALDRDEFAEFEAHLADCESCQREVAELSETVGQLSNLAQTVPPPGLRGSILTAISEVRQLPAVEKTYEPLGAADEPSWSTPGPRRMAPVSYPANEIDAESDTGIGEFEAVSAPQDELAARRSRRSTRLLALAAAAALVVALALGGWVVDLRQDRQAQVASATLEAQLLAAPDLRVVTVPVKGGGGASFRVSKSLNRALFVGDDLPALAADKSYQLWTIRGAGATPAGVFDGGAAPRTWLAGDVREADGAAITIEPRGGSQTPTLPVLVSANL